LLLIEHKILTFYDNKDVDELFVTKLDMGHQEDRNNHKTPL